MIKRRKDKKNVCVISTIHDDKMVPTRVKGQDMEKPNVVTDYNSGMGGVDLIDSYWTSYCNTRKRLKKYCQKHLCHLISAA
jgi:hypothetical protein